jgi:hypothetical protein
MSYNRYIGRRCNFCGYRQNLRVDGTFRKHPVSPKDKTVCEGTGKLPSDRPETIAPLQFRDAPEYREDLIARSWMNRIPGFGRGG